MAEMLIRWLPRAQEVGDPRVDHLRDQAGDVIVIMPDGHPWSQTELTDQHWRLVKVPGVDVSAMNDFVQHDEDALGRTMRYRGVHLDVSHNALAALKDRQVATLPSSAVKAARKGKPPVAGAPVIG